MPAARRGGAPVGSVLAWTLLGVVAGCGPDGAPPEVSRLMPGAAYSDTPVAVAIYGSGFRPTYRVDVQSGATSVDPTGFQASLSPNSGGGGPSVDLQNVVWQSLGLLAGEIPPGTPVGWYDLTVRDPRGRKATFLHGFESMGTDTAPPLVRISSPPANTTFAAGASVPVVIVADDGNGVVTSLSFVMSSDSGFDQTYTCAVTGQSIVTCPFTFPAPASAGNPDELTITATAIGSGGLVGQVRGAYPLQRGPSVQAFTPSTGSTRGGTEVTIHGGNFAPDQTTVSFDGLPATIEDLSTGSVTVLTPPHPTPGVVHLTVTVAGVTVQAASVFTYLPSPFVRSILPTSGPASGGFPVTIVGDNFASATTHIYFGTAPLQCPTFMNANRIDGLAPPGTGTQAVSAVDDKSGTIPNMTVPFQYIQDGGVVSPSDISGVAVDAGAGDAAVAEPPCPGSAS